MGGIDNGDGIVEVEIGADFVVEVSSSLSTLSTSFFTILIPPALVESPSRSKNSVGATYVAQPNPVPTKIDSGGPIRLLLLDSRDLSIPDGAFGRGEGCVSQIEVVDRGRGSGAGTSDRRGAMRDDVMVEKIRGELRMGFEGVGR